MEVEGKTLKELLNNLVAKISDNIKFSGNYENFSTKFEVKGKNMEEAIERFSKKIIDYYQKKKAIFEELEIEIVPGKKWILKCSLKGKTYESIDVKIKALKIVKLEETIEGWKLSFSVE